MALRNHTFNQVTWLNEYEFVCTMDYRSPYVPLTIVAGYGWVRRDKPGASFAIYTIRQGHISKLGVTKRENIPGGIDMLPVGMVD